MPPLPPHPAQRWGSHCSAKGAGCRDSAPKAGVAEYRTWAAQKGRKSLVFVAFVRFSDQLQAFQLRSTAKKVQTCSRDPKCINPFYVTAL